MKNLIGTTSFNMKSTIATTLITTLAIEGHKLAFLPKTPRINR